MPRKKKEVVEQLEAKENDTIAEYSEEMFHVKAVIAFHDLEAKVKRKVGDEWDVTAERLKVLTGDNPMHKVFAEKL